MPPFASDTRLPAWHPTRAMGPRHSSVARFFQGAVVAALSVKAHLFHSDASLGKPICKLLSEIF